MCFSRGFVLWHVAAWCGLSIPLSGAAAVATAWAVFGRGRGDRAALWTQRTGWWSFTERVVLEPGIVWLVGWCAVALEGLLRASV